MKHIKKFKEVSDYIKNGMKFLRLCNIINFRNREDIDYIEERVNKYFSEKTDDKWIESAKSRLKIENGMVKRKSIDELRVEEQEGPDFND